MAATRAIVLAAGEGVRLRPLTTYRPKPMLPAATSPIIEHVLDELIAAGIEEITLVVGHKGERIQSYFGPAYREVDLTYRIQKTQLGTGHALRVAEPPDEPYLLVNGDQIVDQRLIREVIDSHGDAAVSLGVIPGRDVSDYGGAIVRDGHVVDLVDRPTDHRDYYLNAGVYCCNPMVTDAVAELEPDGGERSIIDAIVSLIDSEKTVNAVVSDGYWADANYPWDLLSIAADLLGQGRSKRLEAYRREDISVHESATIREPVAIGPNSEIGPGAVIGPDTAIGENVTVGANAVVQSSVLDRDTRIGPNATIIDTVTGIGARLGAAATVPGGLADVRIGNRIFPDRRLGALIADRVVDGGGTSYEPGSIVGPDVSVETGATVRGVIEAGTHIGR